MTDDIYRQTRKPVEVNAGESQSESPSQNPLESVESVQKAMEADSSTSSTPPPVSSPFSNPNPDGGLKISGNIPPQVLAEMNKGQNPQQSRPAPMPMGDGLRVQGSSELESLLQKLSDKSTWEPIELPSKGKFYKDIPPVLHVRPMTGEEEQILATPRWVKKGQAVDMIFSKCIREQIDTEKLLSVDRNYILIFLRGISYTPEYDVEIKCPACSTNFSTIINLDAIEVEECPDSFDTSQLVGRLPTTNFEFRYRLATGADEKGVTEYRDRRVQMFGDQSQDDTLLYRTAVLLEWIEGVTDRREIQVLLKRLPINDVAHLRNVVNEPPFGVDTQIPMICPSCAEEFKITLPLETNFFFPRKKKASPTQA